MLLALMLFMSLQVVFAQRTITGKVTSAEDSTSIPGATVLVKGTTVGAITDADGRYMLTVPKDKNVIVVSFVGMKSQEITLGDGTVFNVVLASTVQELEGVVVTALGIPREKKSLGYATQEVKGDQIAMSKTDNFVNSLSGLVAGAQITTTTNMGGSTNVLLRGSKSLTGDNQAMFVVDGVPINNAIINTRSQEQAGQGYDYGNAASDINPDDIESVNVLKGAAATALYGSRAANGVIMITTKKGSLASGAKKGLGVTINSNVTIGTVDSKTLPTYQDKYGAGYGHYYDGAPGDEFWYYRYINPDNTITVDPTYVGQEPTQWVVTSEDASYGAPFDGHLVYQWDAVDPASPNYLKATPWKYAANGPASFFETAVTTINTVAIDNAFSKGSYRLGYTNFNSNGIMPNSKLVKNNVSMAGTWNINDKFTASASGVYNVQHATGRNSTGYNDNIMSSFRQWMQTNVDIQEQKEMYDLTNRNVTWNYADPSAAYPIYWDNYYWTRYQNYETDRRNRFTGYVSLDYKIAPWLDIFGRMSVDSYYELQEERRAVGSIAATFGIGTGQDGSLGRSDQASGYLRRDIDFSEYNYDLMANFNKDLSKNFNLKGVLGMNIRRSNYNQMINSTNGGLNVPELYSLQNSVGPLPLTKEYASKIGVNGYYLSVSLGYKNFLYLDGTIRNDNSSTLPPDNASYWYPSVAGSFIFSQLMKDSKWLSFGKLRLNYAVVGNSAPFDYLYDIYDIITPFYSSSSSVNGTMRNPELKPEMTNSLEGGLEMYFFGRRLGFDLALYKTNSFNQILPLPVSTATGYSTMIINAGEIQNKGIELQVNGVAVKQKNFKWDITVNWSLNRNEVISLMEGVDNLQLGRFQGGVTINARVGQPYGVICGTDYTYYNGERVINPANGRYVMTTKSDIVIGNSNPDWRGGLVNTLSYKNWALSFLIDCQMGGDIFSLDMYYGLATGLYQETAINNDLGNPVRNPIAYNTPGDPTSGYAPTSGGFINQGVNLIKDANGNVTGSTPNTTRIAASNYGAFGYVRNPNAAFIYDATYVKFRNLSLSYNLPSALLKNTFISGITISAIANNLWIIYKAMPYADPESGLGAGNLQGYSIGSLPSTRDFTFNVKLTF